MNRYYAFYSRLTYIALITVALLSLFPIGAGADCDPAGVKSIGLILPDQVREAPVSSRAANDFIDLLRKAFKDREVSLNDPEADLLLVVSGGGSFAKGPQPETGLFYPEHGYSWESSCDQGAVTLTLRSVSYQGVSNGLYGLLQEKLGYKFYHPRGTIIPSHNKWPLPVDFNWKAEPRFPKKGFHIHSLHPVELAEQLNDPYYPGALEDIKEYIDWLARNQQNVFQFHLLRGIHRTPWIEHARSIVDYAHQRGILVGAGVSLSMLQQRAFRLVNLVKLFPGYKKQAEKSLDWLFRAEWDFVSINFLVGEHLPDLEVLMPELRVHVIDLITEKYGAKAMITTHVIRSNEQSGLSGKDDRSIGLLLPEDPHGDKAGILIHTVMCYSLMDISSPVYGNNNQCFMLDRAVEESQRRETWYWPESAYWITFDNSVPLLLLPYLESRLADMGLMQELGINGHITFSSGWEWGYWLVDWSIARWSWEFIEDGRTIENFPLSVLADILPEPALWSEALEIQTEYLKEKGLMPYLAALAPFAELPWPFDKPFLPRPEYTLAFLADEADEKDIMKALAGPVSLLDEYADKMEQVAKQLDLTARKRDMRAEELMLMGELVHGLKISAMRARQKALVMKAAIARGRGARPECMRLLDEAEKIRQKSLHIVRQREEHYRYPVALLAAERESYTSYDFGYLYPVSDLFFWLREQEQVRNGRFDALYMNMWDFPKVSGLDDLLW